MDAGDDDAAALFQSYGYVQSPSAASQSGNSTTEAVLSAGRHPSSSSSLSSFVPIHISVCGAQHDLDSAHSHALSRYSSSRGSNDSFLNDRKLHDEQEKRSASSGRRNWEEGDGLRRKSGLMAKLVILDSLGRDSFYCAVFQWGWKLLGSLGLALLVFFLATKPPPPLVSFNIVGVSHFRLGEGLDVTGVATEVLSCNCSVEMEVDNKSKIFGLHIHSPFLELAFGRLKFASSQSPESYIQTASSSLQRFFVGVKNKPMYGAGRNMQDLLDSGHGLPLTVRIRLRSSYRVVWDLIKIRHHHHEDCIMILQGMHVHMFYANLYNSTCFKV